MVKIQYQESLFHEDGTKGNRDEWQGKEMKGCYDVIIPGWGAAICSSHFGSGYSGM